MIGRLLPREVVTVVATADMWDDELYPEEAVLIRDAVEKRRREFTAGRSCARRALQVLGVENHPLLAGEHKEPLWPDGIVGSLTHSDRYCAVAVARIEQVGGIGIDAEASDMLIPELITLVCTEAEIEWVRRAQPPEHGDWHKVIFSAKESVYKCLFPSVRRMLDYHDVEIELVPNMRRFLTRLLLDDLSMKSQVPPVSGRFELGPEHIFTGAIIDPTPGSQADNPVASEAL